MTTLPVANTVRVLAVRHAFSEDVRECVVEAGRSLRWIIGEGCVDERLAVTLDGTPIAPEFWASTVPAAGSVVTACPRPRGGDARSIILTIGLIAASYFSGGLIAGALAQSGSATAFLLGSSATTFWTGAVYVVGSLHVNALVRR